MRITKLHLLIAFLLMGLGFVGYHLYQTKQAEQKKWDEQIALQKKLEEEERLKKMAESEAQKSETPPVPPAPATPSAVSYTVQRGDTLWKIAKMKEHFGQGHRWYDIWKANEEIIADFDKLISGQVLTIPLDKPDGYEWPKTGETKKEKLIGTDRENSGETN